MQLYVISPWVVLYYTIYSSILYYISIYGQLFILFLAHNVIKFK